MCGSLTECAHDAESEETCGAAHTSRARPPAGGAAGGEIAVERRLNSDDSEEDTCEMVTNATIPPGAEVFNTYGESLTNAQLLIRYGFVLDSNENDTLTWEDEDLAALVDSGEFSELQHSLAGSKRKARGASNQEGPPASLSGQAFLGCVRDVAAIWPRGHDKALWAESSLVCDPGPLHETESVDRKLAAGWRDADADVTMDVDAELVGRNLALDSVSAAKPVQPLGVPWPKLGGVFDRIYCPKVCRILTCVFSFSC